MLDLKEVEMIENELRFVAEQTKCIKTNRHNGSRKRDGVESARGGPHTVEYETRNQATVIG